MILMDSKHITLNPVLGEVEEIVVVNNAILMQLFLRPATSSTTYDVELRDTSDNIIFSANNVIGELHEELNLPAYSNQTIRVFNSLVDEAYTCILTYRRA